MTTESKNQGEGNRTADREYRERTKEFIESDKVADAAQKAKEAIEGDEKEGLKAAEKTGKKHARH